MREDLEDDGDEHLLNKFQQGRYLVILDGLEAIEFETLMDKKRVEDFIQCATRGNSIIILSGRRKDCALSNIVHPVHRFCLTGLSMQGAMQLAELHTTWTSKQISQRANRDFVERVLIFLERNPLAIKLVFPALNKKIDTPELLLHKLLYGVVKIDEITTSDSTFVSHMRWIWLSFALGNRFGKFTPGTLSPFCNYFPRDLRNYYWFLWSFAFKDGTEIKWQAEKATLGNWAQVAWQ